MHSLSFFLGAIGICQTAYALRFQHQYLPSGKVSEPSDYPLETEYVELPIDHFGNYTGTYNNRFWIQDKYYKPGGPVFIFDAGESGVQNYTVQDILIGGANNTFMDFVQSFNGLGILWEHRYYGGSLPFPVNENTTSVQLQFLTVEQALADVPVFAAKFSRSNINYDLTPSGTPWVFVGGSYPGVRSAMLRNHFPDTIFASYATSAPVQASIDMSFYYEPIWQGMNAYGWGNCSQDIKAAIEFIDVQMEDDDIAFKIKEGFLGVGGGNNTNPAFAEVLSQIFSNWQDGDVQPNESLEFGLGDFCNWLEYDPDSKQFADQRGWAAVKGAEWVVDHWASWPIFIDWVNGVEGTTCLGPAATKAQIANATNNADFDCTFSPVTDDPDSISWTWQYCTQFGFFQAANVGPHQLVSKYSDLFYWKQKCHMQFPDGAKSGFLPDWPLADQLNYELGGWNIRPSNTFWVANQFDPWRTLTPLSPMPCTGIHGQAINSTPQCVPNGNTTVQETSLFGFLVPDAEHCFDFRSNVVQGDDAVGLFKDALTGWLKCFKPVN